MAKSSNKKTRTTVAKKVANKKVANRKVAVKKPTSSVISKKVVKTPVEVTDGPKRLFPISISNLFIFILIFTVLALAQVAIKQHGAKKVELHISAAEITPDAEYVVPEVEVIASAARQSGEVPVKPATVPLVAEPIVEEEVAVAATPVTKEVEELAEPVKNVADGKCPTCGHGINEEVTAVKEEVAKKEKRFSKRYLSDPYTNGGPLDLDGPSSRELYKSSNVVKIKKGEYFDPRQYKLELAKRLSSLSSTDW